MLYVIDSSSLIHLNRNYPIDIFEPIWAHISAMANDGLLLSHRQVRMELKAGDAKDPARLWAREHKGIFVDPDGAQQVVLQKILKEFPNLANAMKQKEHADPWCVAFARVLADEGKGCCLINEELPRGDGSHRIPNVCRRFDVKYSRLVPFFRDVGISWRR